MHLDIDGIGGAFMTLLWQLKRFEARIPLFKSLDCPLALAAAGMNQRFTRYPPVINHNLGWCNWGLNQITNIFQKILPFNSLGPSDAIWRWRSWSTLVQVMACCLTAPSHYLNQCWLIISKVLWHSSEDIITRRLSKARLKIAFLKSH